MSYSSSDAIYPHDNSFQQSQSLPENIPSTSGSGLKLVLPPLKFVKGKKGKKSKGQAFAQDEGIRKIPRPPKLKPLREVLSKLITQIKKKDDYAFFLKPVDVSQVSGYTELIKHPMDLGTMTEKVAKGRYRSLEEFASDFHLVTSNAKLFNPPGTIYYTEAERIQAWGDEHIQKAAATVIEFETDWNIDIEREDSEQPEDQARGRDGTPSLGIDGGSARSPSVVSNQALPSGSGRRQGRAQATTKKGAAPTAPGTISESIDAEGHLPGSHDGLGAFPYGSDFARLMLALKLKGKRKRTKKERLKLEKGGPPYATDGSLDYAELDEPFSAFSVLVPEPLARPQLTPLTPLHVPTNASETPLPAPVNVPVDHPLPDSPSHLAKPAPSSKRRHWSIIRNAPSRGKGKEKDEDVEQEVDAWKAPRDAHTLDFGPYATFMGKLAEEMRERHGRDPELGTEEALFTAIRESVQITPPPSEPDGDPEYWSEERATEAEEYIRDVVYGGVDGFAYVRSLAEFVSREGLEELPSGDGSYSGLGMPLSQYVEHAIVDPLTGGRHHILVEAARQLKRGVTPYSDPDVTSQINLSLHTYPTASYLLSIARSPIDMAPLIHAPSELFQAESEWVGGEYMEKQRVEAEAERERKLVEEKDGAAEYLAFAIQSHNQALAAGKGEVQEGPDVFEHSLDYSKNTLLDLVNGDQVMKAEGDGEDAVTRKLRFTLLALAKRAPLDKIARLPADLVPPHLRNVVPTIGY
ncbi:hypothetical protein JAAARDRAFT_40819 [Jaapia argillacea MUCL 33604]|uniref:Bromo domain-containing protein n=1 Tax=Jaapia argillacea MUCL 33604 TaxID=933084 RepID=A0A067PAI5_9AGAM|nr:hypothetical protein JAAARDRAFT_40819 [Jaapia argillacea MUCL 33604]